MTRIDPDRHFFTCEIPDFAAGMGSTATVVLVVDVVVLVVVVVLDEELDELPELSVSGREVVVVVELVVGIDDVDVEDDVVVGVLVVVLVVEGTVVVGSVDVVAGAAVVVVVLDVEVETAVVLVNDDWTDALKLWSRRFGLSVPRSVSRLLVVLEVMRLLMAEVLMAPSSWRRRATTPAVCGAAIEVPERDR